MTNLKVVKNMYNCQLQDKEVHVLKTPAVVREQPHPAAWLHPDNTTEPGSATVRTLVLCLCIWPVTYTLAWSHDTALLCCSSPAAVHPSCALQNISVSGPCTNAALVISEVRNLMKESLYLCYCSLCVCAQKLLYLIRC